MIKLLAIFVTLLVSSQSLALTLEKCAQYSDEQIAKLLMYSIALGGQSGSGNDNCAAEAAGLDVLMMSEELSEATTHIVKSYRITSIAEPTEESAYVPVVSYEITTLNGQKVKGKFSFKRHTNFQNPASINRKKCAAIESPPESFFILKRCL